MKTTESLRFFYQLFTKPFFMHSSERFYLYQMKPLLLSLILVSFLTPAYAQTEDAQTLHENAKKFMRQGDYANATVILVRAFEQAPGDIGIAKDLALSYYMQSDNNRALNALKPFVDKDNADAQAYQIVGMVYKRMSQPKDAEKVYKKGLKSYPESGPLYNDYGELLWSMQDSQGAIAQWENGIKAEPSFAGNYYNATKFYYLSPDKIWELIYGEIFVNIESYSSRTAEIKNLLLEGYKKLFSDPDLLTNSKGKNKFEIAYLTVMNKQNSIVLRGIGAESLTMIRTRFLLDWYRKYANNFPFFLFDMQKYMAENDLFQAYNQWLFGTAENLGTYQNWVNTHPDQYHAFTEYLKNRNLKIPNDQYYH